MHYKDNAFAAKKPPYPVSYDAINVNLTLLEITIQIISIIR